MKESMGTTMTKDFKQFVKEQCCSKCEHKELLKEENPHPICTECVDKIAMGIKFTALEYEKFFK